MSGQDRMGLSTKSSVVTTLQSRRQVARRYIARRGILCLCSREFKKRRLILMRHAESSTIDGVRDHDLPISDNGRITCKNIAQELHNLGWSPDIVVSSNALRSKQTFEALKSVIAQLGDADLHFLGSLYTLSQLDGQTLSHLGNLISQEASCKVDCILCLGHNKGWEEAASTLAGKPIFLDHCDAALFEIDGTSWEGLLNPDVQKWKLVRVIRAE